MKFWMDTMPVLPMPDECVSVYRYTADGSIESDTFISTDCDGRWWLADASAWVEIADQAEWRIDLGTDNGFGYGMRQLCQRAPEKWGKSRIGRWVMGKTTPDDRDALAASLQEVFG